MLDRVAAAGRQVLQASGQEVDAQLAFGTHGAQATLRPGRQAAGRDLHLRSIGEAQLRHRPVRVGARHPAAYGAHLGQRGRHQGEDEVQVMDHQVQHDRDIEARGRNGATRVASMERRRRLPQPLPQGTDRRRVALDLADHQHQAAPAAKLIKVSASRAWR
jgi:hypothetical protein